MDNGKLLLRHSFTSCLALNVDHCQQGQSHPFLPKGSFVEFISLEGLKEFWVGLSCAEASASKSAEKKEHAVFPLIAHKLETFSFMLTVFLISFHSNSANQNMLC